MKLQKFAKRNDNLLSPPKKFRVQSKGGVVSGMRSTMMNSKIYLRRDPFDFFF